MGKKSTLTAQQGKDLEFVLSKIKQYMPLLMGFLNNDTDLASYSKKLYEHKPVQQHLDRQKACVEIINAKLSKLFPGKETREMNLPLENGIAASVVDHHNILNHPILVSGIIISNLYRFLEGTKEGILVLSCGGIPFSNNFHKRGFTFRGKVLPFVTAKDRDKTIHFFPKRRLEFFEAAQKNKLLEGFTGKELDFLWQYEKTINSIDLSMAGDFADQMTLINNRLFPLMFSEKLRAKIPQMIYFESEYLAAEIVKRLIKEKNNFVYRTLFDPAYREAALKEFDGIWGAWDSKKGLGTHFFWLMQENGEEVALKCNGNKLVPKKDGLQSISLEPGEVTRLLDEKRIYPHLMLNYGALIFYCGIKPLTGIGSLNYLTDMKKAWFTVLEKREPNEAGLVSKIDPSGLIAAPIVTYGRDRKGKIAEKYFADLVFEGGLSADYLKKLGEMKIRDLLRSSLISIYDIKVPTGEKRPLSISTSDLVSEGFDWIK